ncbi:MAG: hypothetical protein E3J46_06725 [Desulfobacteraceae bacterium]|jgi:hypothetical protein|nr:MAG: hypothetical protein E3J46_06725 [Desulfobacteraceae bacterium]
MKKGIYLMIGAFFIVGLLGCASIGTKGGPSPKVTVITPTVKLSKKATITIKGAGFKPGQEVAILFTAIDGVQSDIDYTLKPKPVADKTGAWLTTWSCGRFVSKKLIKEGTYTLMITDVDYNQIAKAKVTFVK